MTHINFKDIKILDYVGPMGPGSYTERRYLLQVGDKQVWYVEWSTNNGSGDEWELVDPNGDRAMELPDRDELVDDIPENVSQHIFDEDEPTVYQVAAALATEFEDEYWPKFDEVVQPVIDAMNKEMFPWQG